MNREIKFRAWDIERREIFIPFSLSFQKTKGMVCRRKIKGSSNDIIEVPKVQLMQYTGLLDKNGKEIYEGDILRSDVHIVTVVYTDESASFDLETIKKGLMGMAGVNSILEIIGNIYENPELMEASDEKA